MAVLWITADDLSEPDNPLAPMIAEAASFVLYKLSGQKYPGNKTVTEWYGRRGAACWACIPVDSYADGSGNIIQPHGHRFFSGKPRGLRTRGKPITAVTSIETATGVLDPSEYEIANHGVIYRTSGLWDFATGVTVTYSYGLYPPALGRLAAIQLGNELLLGYTSPDDCALSDRVTSVTRQGLSFDLEDLTAALAEGRIGIYDVDLFISTVNPSRALSRPRIFSPDIPRGERYL